METTAPQPIRDSQRIAQRLRDPFRIEWWLYLTGDQMRITEVCNAWVVYRMTLHGNAVAGNVVCEQREWDVLEAARPGFHTLLHTGIKTEQEAERLARGNAGETPPRGSKKKAALKDALPPAILP
jgi:hypothetical protein